MNYQQLLKKAVADSGWSMREIARRCSRNGVSISQSYISQLANGEVPPASDGVNQALGEVLSMVTDIDPNELLLASYRQKIPDHILKQLKETV